MGYFPVRYDSRVVIYDRRGFIRLATVVPSCLNYVKKDAIVENGSHRSLDPSVPTILWPQVRIRSTASTLLNRKGTRVVLYGNALTHSPLTCSVISLHPAISSLYKACKNSMRASKPRSEMLQQRKMREWTCLAP